MALFKRITLCAFLSLVWMNSTAQYLAPFHEKFEVEVFEQLLQLEKETQDSTIDPALRGKKLLELARKAGLYHEPLRLEYFAQALQLFETAKNDSLQSHTYNVYSIPYINTGDFERAEELLHKALAYSVPHNDSANIGLAKIHFGYMELRQSHLDKALEYYYEAKKLLATSDPDGDLGNVYNRIISLFIEMEDYHSATQAFEEYASIPAQNNPRVKYYNTVLYNASTAFDKIGEYEQATTLLNEVIHVWRNAKSPKLAVHFFSKMASLEEKKENWAKAELFADSALIKARIFDHPTLLAISLSKKYSIILERGNHRRGFPLLQEAFQISKTLKVDDIKAELLEKMAHHMHLEKKHELAYRYQSQADSIQELLILDQVANQVKEIEKKMIREQSDKEIQLLATQNELKEANLSKARRDRILLSVLLVMLTLALLPIYLLFRQRNKNNRLLKSKNETISKALEDNKSLVKEVHHRVKNNLQVVSSLLSLQSRYLEDDAALQAIKNSKERVQSMSILHRNLYNNEDLKTINIQDYFEDLGENLFKGYAVGDKELRFSAHIDEITLDVDKVVTMGLIVNELISNALKHAFNDQQEGKVSLTIRQEKEHVLLEVKDNGSGVSFTELPKESTSLGTQLIKSFCKKLRAQLEIINTEGTLFRIHIPLQK